MKSKNKLLKLAYYGLLILAGGLLYYFSEVKGIIRSLGESQDGILISLFNKIAPLFTDADAWSLIFFTILLSTSFVLFVLSDIGIQKGLRVASGKFPKLAFTSSEWFKMTIQKALSGGFVFMLFVFISNLVIVTHGNKFTYTQSSNITEPKPVLILGTSKMLSSGVGENLYYRYRIDAALELFESGKVEQFIISGDRAGDHYDETRDIKEDLLAAGVPEEMIKLDTAGFRTLDSMMRIRALWGLNDMIVISQKFHIQRALFQAWFYGVNASGYEAKGSATWGMRQREALAKPKVVLDLFLFNMQPRVPIRDLQGNIVEYREDFEVTSDLHILLLLFIIAGALTALGAVYKTIET